MSKVKNEWWKPENTTIAPCILGTGPHVIEYNLHYELGDWHRRCVNCWAVDGHIRPLTQERYSKGGQVNG